MPRRTYEVAVGERYGSLVVTEIGLRVEPHAAQRARSQPGNRAALTLCDCGRTRLAEIGRLVVGRVKHCGKCTAPRVMVSTDDAINRAETADPPADTHEAPPRRRSNGGRRPLVIDTSAFEALMAEAMIAYSMDSMILERMLRNANQIRLKRRAWAIRSELRAAEAESRAACESSSLTECHVTEPCGCGPCPWATGDRAELVGIPSLPSKSGSTNRATRPQPRPAHLPGHTYSIEAALLPLMELRTSRGAFDSEEPHADSMPS